MNGLKRCWIIAARELRTIARDHSLLLTLLLAPLLYAFFYGSIYINKEEVNVPLAVVDDDQSALSRLLTEQFNNTQAIQVVGAKDMREAQEMLNREDVQGYIYLQEGTGRKSDGLAAGQYRTGRQCEQVSASQRPSQCCDAGEHDR